MIYAKLFTNFSHFGVYRLGIQIRGDKSQPYLLASVHQRCRAVAFSETLREVAMALAVVRSASGGIRRFIGMAIVRTAGRETLHGGIAGCSQRLQRRAHNTEAIL